MRKLAENLGIILLICLGVRIGAVLIEPVLPILGGIVITMFIVVWLFGRGGHGGGYR